MSILVVGDVMLDVYIEGIVKRISPEAPVPVLQICNETHAVGGAANVARNIAALGGNVTLFSVVGNGHPGDKIGNELANYGVPHSFVYDRNRWGTIKTRYEAHGQQILRVDDECTEDISQETATILLNRIGQHFNDCKVLVLSDYAKGVLTYEVCRRLIEVANTRGITTIVDPKQKNLSRYMHASMIKPNAIELADATGMPTTSEEECSKAAKALIETFQFGHVLVTRGGLGMLLRDKDRAWHAFAHRVEVANVVGAGDTALAAMAVALAEGANNLVAMEIANKAASIVVGKHGTAVVTRQEVADAFARV